MTKVLEQRLCNQNTNINYYECISPQAVDFLVRIADGNVRRLLEFTDMIFDFHWRRFHENNPIAHKEEYKVTFPAAKEILSVNNINVDGYVGEMEKLEKKPAGKQEQVAAKQKQRAEQKTPTKAAVAEQHGILLPELNKVTQTFDKEFTLAEQNVLRSVARHEQMTLKQIATDIHLEINKCNGVIANLKKKNAIVSIAKASDGEKSWQLTESAKRAMVTK